MNRPTNIRLRFTLLYGAALVATVVLFSAGVYYFVQKLLFSQIDNHLRKDLATVVEYLRRDPAGLEKLARFGSVHYFRVQKNGRTLVSSNEWLESGLQYQRPAMASSPEPVSVINADNKPFRIISRQEQEDQLQYLITVAHEEGTYRRTLRTLGLIILLILPVSIAGSLAVGYLIAGRVLAPITAITQRAADISAENLSARLPVDGSDNELSRLAVVFNQTFTRLEESFERLRRFTADASHELRTPLTAIRSIGETALQQQPGALDCHETIGSILEETDRLVQTVEALLILSRADSQALERQPVDVGELVADVVDFLGVLAEEKSQRLHYLRNTDLTIAADPGVLRRAFLNLLDNAIKYSPQRGDITIALFRNEQGETLLDFVDCGPGIPDEEKERIFNRFYRLDAGRARTNGGTGLGLAIAKTAVEVHGGTITLLDAPSGGACFRISFPGSRS
ncbi:ATP-binding protein [Trichlorobacter ammonificans]|uniref:histidine kinase n=1 Tax=Trichlorobacter ammonificans TaxID=2916410 RepID=A0ABM9DAL5_9BACT|nr:ATP-binding protein [Trichlorobacter ammonificans]CAH2031814.1 Histidine kinase [Trichlorobacter ammonificans]